jgi:ABC-type Fe3+ transport system permease subunit
MSQGAQGSTWLGNVSSYDVVFATAIGYLWRYFPIALVFFYFALLAIPRRVVAAARNMNISWLRIHYAILLPGIKNTLFLLTIFLFLTFLFDGVSVAVLGYGQSQTFGSLLLETASTMSLVGAASAGGIVYLVIASVILFQFLSCMSEEIETSARVDDCEDFGGFKGWKSDITALVNVLWIAIYGITITCGILLLSVGYDRDSRGFFSRGLPTFEGYTTMFLRGGGLGRT